VLDKIYVYKYDYKPTRAQALAGTNNGGLIETISSWSDSDTDNGKTFTVAAIDDPDPTSETRSYTYWIAVNFKYTNTEQIQTIVRALPMQRIDAWHKTVNTTTADLENLWPQIDSYRTSEQQRAAIDLAKALCEQDLEAEGYEWALIWRPDKLDLAVAHRAVAQLYLGLATGAGREQWLGLAESYKETYKAMLQALKVEYDSERSDEPTTKERHANFRRVIV
jgi:hypothetical protein